MGTRPDRDLLVRAQCGSSPVWRRDPSVPDGWDEVPLADLGITDRLRLAFEDWAAFHAAIDGDLDGPGDRDVADEFVGQGWKLAHKLRGELKGSSVQLCDPVTGDLHTIVRTRVR